MRVIGPALGNFNKIIPMDHCLLEFLCLSLQLVRGIIHQTATEHRAPRVNHGYRIPFFKTACRLNDTDGKETLASAKERLYRPIINSDTTLDRFRMNPALARFFNVL